MARVADAARGEAAPPPDGAASNIAAAALGALGLATISTAITLAATYQPPPGGLSDHTCVPLALSGLAFFTGIAQDTTKGKRKVWPVANTRLTLSILPPSYTNTSGF
ncbi:hypothetical protein ABZP36_014861 [Zizania latifolia]